MPYAGMVRSNYAAGDYYGGAGGWRRGDPGLFSSIGNFFKGAVHTVSGIAGALLPAPFSAPAKVVNKLTGGGGTVVRSFNPATPTFPPPPSLPIGPGQSQLPMPMGAGGALCGTRGFRANKSTYVTRGGGTSRWPQQLVVHPAGTECVKGRRMNVANPRALRRALRRVAGFGKLASRARRDISRAATAVGVHHRTKKLPRRR